MAQDSKIEWTHHTQNLWHGCTHVHEGCDNCYAEALSHRWGNDIWGNDKPRKFIQSASDDLYRYQARAQKAGEVHRVFVGSMMDIFEKPMPMIDSKGVPMAIDTDYTRQIFFDNISDGLYPNILFLLLTKRPSNINKYIPEHWKQHPPDNVMFGTSPVNQATFNTLTQQLKQVNGRRFLSIEPQLGLISDPDLSGIDWVIQGGESGPRSRPFEPDWAHVMAEQCDTQGVPFFFKQTGTWLAKDWDLKNAKGSDLTELIDFMRIRQFPKATDASLQTV
ncbi:MAG: hypothetical protein JWP57_725 [Spirosoma sp.]|nr:hypothetical protein [Spirosoma sp.]